MFLFVLALGLFSCKNEGQDAAAQAQADSLAVASQVQAPESGQVSNFNFPDVEGKIWKLSEYEYDGNTNPPFDKSVLTLQLMNGKATGNAGCNDFNGTVELKGNGELSFSGIAKTKMLCNSRMTQETRFIELLETATSYEANMIFLKIKGPKGMLTFRNDNK